MDFALDTAYGFALVLFRVAGLCVTAPLLGTRVVPTRVRLGAAVVLALAVAVGAGMPRVALPVNLLGLGLASSSQTLLGLLAGWTFRVVLDAALGAGHLVGTAAGLGFGATMNPMSGTESTTLSTLFSLLATAAALQAGVHRTMILWLCRSIQAYPPGAPVALSGLLHAALEQTVGSIALSVRLGFPMLTAFTCGHVIFGAVGRSTPQLGLGNLGFSVSLLVGGGVLYLLAPEACALLGRQVAALSLGR
jgi:flagellar biosynthetic protein FliR